MLDTYKSLQKSFYNFIIKVKKNNKISHAYLIETKGLPYGYDLALSMAKYFLCSNNYSDVGDGCSSCNICNQIDNGNYLDLVVIDNEFNEIKKDQMIDLQKKFSTKAVFGKYKIYIIKNANMLNKSSANAILKFLEEPEDNVIAILLTSNVNGVLSTIVSRCQLISLFSECNSSDLFIKYNVNNIDDFYNVYSNKIVQFYEKLENFGNYLIAYKDDFVDNECFKLYLEYGLYVYYDVLKLYYDDGLLCDFVDIKKNIMKKNSISDIIYKIDVINEFLLNIKYNVNKDLFVDNFIICFGGDISD